MRPIRPRKQLELAERRAEVARRICRGETYREIAGDLGVGIATVAADKAAVIAEWRERYAGDIGGQAALDLARLDNLIARLDRTMAEATPGELPALARAYLAALARRAAILGFDARDRRESGLHLLPEHAEVVPDDVPMLHGRPVGKGDAARIFAAFATEAPDTAESPAPGDREVETAITMAQYPRRRGP